MQKIYLVPHTHYDVAWAFTKEDYLDLNESFLEKAIELIKESDEVILRFFETAGEPTKAKIEFFQDIERATSANLLEEEEQELAVKGNKLRLEVKPFEIVTLKLEF